jgi:glycosyltransferase involved in cell wall biosynthesis
MKIAINAIPYLRWSGIETFLHGLLAAWPINSRDEIVIFANQESAKFLQDLPAGIKINIHNFKSLSRWRLFLYQQINLPLILWRQGFDILFCASLLAPWIYFKKIITIHDAAPFVLKEENSAPGKIFWRINLLFARLASLKIITVSKFSRDELIKYLGIKEKNLEIIYNGSPDYQSGGASPESNNSAINYCEYIIAVGNARPRKNLSQLIKAFEILSPQAPELKLVIVGKNDWRMQEIMATVHGLEEKIIFSGFVSETEKQNLIKNAEALIFPSLYEGFGLPIVEANALKTPLICSDIPSFREVAGESALFFNPLDVSSLVAKIQELITNPELKKSLIASGQTNSQRFNWSESARKLSELIHSYETSANK